MNYAYCTVEDVADMLGDRELIDLAKDFAKVLHDCEWWHSGDICKGNYNQTVDAFKKKWFQDKREIRIGRYIDDVCAELKREFGCGSFCKDCVKWNPVEKEDYGTCPHRRGCLIHGWDDPCEEFEEFTEKEKKT